MRFLAIGSGRADAASPEPNRAGARCKFANRPKTLRVCQGPRRNDRLRPTRATSSNWTTCMTIIITDDDVKRLMPMPDCIEAMRVAFRDFANGIAVNRPRMRYLAQ